ncbi:MAG: glycoside hydrolase family 3 C-terminal domain-containing protein [Lewinellaceae bacterium]|nr:glycoside hydrolase family 3 C-terminal domain-containing protein [Lewinellaceae bacterium]
MKKITLVVLSLFFIGQAAVAQPSEKGIEAKIDSILSLLTLEEKVAMCHAQSKFSSPGVPRLGIPEIWMSDGPHGVRAEINWDNWGYAGWTNDSITAFPALTCLAATFNPELSHQYGVAVGEEARYRKKDILLGPGVNIYRTPLNGRNFEYMGEDPHLASVLVVPYIKGVQQNGVAACLKHYALNNQELWRGHINVEVSDRALYEIYLPAYKAAVQEGGVWSIMGAYNQFRGQHCCHNELLLNQILKTDWGFDGVVVTDWGGAHDTREAALYGLDIEMGTGTDGLTTSTRNAYDNYYLALPFLNLIKSGEIEEAVVDDKVRRILRLMFRTNMNPSRPLGRINNPEHLHVARAIAGEGIVLLKNDDQFFPIDPTRKMTIAVIGENATRAMAVGGGSSELKPRDEVSPLRGLKERFRNATIIHSMGYASGPPQYGREVPSKLDADSLRNAAVKAAAQADVVLFFGGLNKNHFQDCEGGDRLQFGLPFGQDELLRELLRANENLGVVLVSGNAVAMPWASEVKGLMQAWYLGSEAGHALADVISGDVNPSGKLPFSFPVKLSDNAAHHFGELSYPGDSVNQYYKEDIFVGYRWHDTQKIKPLFAFGHGLSYTTFELSDAKTDKKSYAAGETITVSCKITNTGGANGAEVAQVYVGKPNSSVKRPVKELKGFRKVHLAKGGNTQVEIPIEVDALAFYDESISGWNLEKGAYTIYVGTASDAIAQQLEIMVK